jgi:excisionase family DNA binding protein
MLWHIQARSRKVCYDFWSSVDRPTASASAHFKERARSSNVAPHLLTALQVATMLGVSKRQVWRLASAGILPGRIKIGKLVRWRRDEIERWIVKGCPKGQRRS